MLHTLTAIGALAGLAVGIRGLRLLVRGLAHADEDTASLDVIRGIRGVAIAVGTSALATGVVLEQRWLLAFGAVFLLEELYETGVVALVLRAALRREPASRGRGARLPSSPSEGPPSSGSPVRGGSGRSGAPTAAWPRGRAPWRAPAAGDSRRAC